MDNPQAANGSITTYNSRYLWSKILRVPFTTEKEVEEQMNETQHFTQPTQPKNTNTPTSFEL